MSTRPIPAPFRVVLISDRSPKELKFDGETLEDLVRDRKGLIFPINLSWFVQNSETAWSARLQLKTIHLFLFDFDYLVRAQSTIRDATSLIKYLASMFCYGMACSMEEVINKDFCDFYIAIISDEAPSAGKHLFPDFVSWTYSPYTKEKYGICISDSKSVKDIIELARFRTILKKRADDGDRRMGVCFL